MQQVVAHATGAEVTPFTSPEEMAHLMNGLSMEQILNRSDKIRKEALREIKAADKEENAVNGRWRQLADTQSIIRQETKGKPWNQVFTSDINSYDKDILNEMGVGSISRAISNALGAGEKLTYVSSPLREAQFNRIAQSHADKWTDAVDAAIERQTQSLDKAGKEHIYFRPDGTVESSVKSSVLGSRVNAFSKSVETLDSLRDQMADVRVGKLIKDADRGASAMANAQTRKFAMLSDPLGEGLNQEIKQASRDIKNISKIASTKKTLREMSGDASVRIILTELVVSKVLGLAHGLAATTGVSLLSGSLKRVKDGLVNKALADASEFVSSESNTFFASTMGELTDWMDEFASKNGRAPTRAEMHKEADNIIEENISNYFDEPLALDNLSKHVNVVPILAHLLESKDE